jgi:hypothetical protein
MKNSTLQYIDKLVDICPIWDRYLQEYWNTNFNLDYDEGDDSKGIEICTKFHSVLLEILKIFISEGGFRDEWELPPKIHFNVPFCNALVTKSAKQKQEYWFGIDAQEGFFIQTDICCIWNLKYMRDDFWQNCIELNQFGTFSFDENITPNNNGKNSRTKYLLGNVKSNVYRLIRNYILLELEQDPREKDEDLYHSYPFYSAYPQYQDFGWFKVVWPLSISWQQLIQDGCEAFKRVYKMNYLLYKHEYQRQKSKKG